MDVPPVVNAVYVCNCRSDFVGGGEVKSLKPSPATVVGFDVIPEYGTADAVDALPVRAPEKVGAVTIPVNVGDANGARLVSVPWM